VAGTTNDVVSLYVHPVGSVTTSEPASLPTSFTGTGTDASDIYSVFVRQGTASENITATIDGLRVATDWGSSIPVELMSFKGTATTNGNKLTWVTASEKDNKSFEIERSTDNRNFVKIGEMKGAGYSQTRQTYNFVDESPAAVSYYRLKQVDYDGTATYSSIVSIVKSGKNASFKAYPTIVNSGVLNLEYKNLGETGQVSVINLLGRTVLTQKLSDTEGVQTLNLSHLPNGFYIVRLNAGKTQLMQRIQKQ
jgi:hypothetical protein